MSSIRVESEAGTATKAMWLYPKVLGFNPPERWGHSACYSQGFIYVFGGCCGGLHFSDVIVLNLETMAWTILSTAGKGPGPRDSHTAILVGRKMIVFGGTNGFKKVNDLHILDLDSREWAQPECKGGPPCPRESHTSTLVGDDKIVVFGGSGEGESNYLNDLYVLDLKTMRWTEILLKGNNNIPVPRDSHSAVSFGTKILVYGGDCGDRYEGNIDVFDMHTQSWSRIVTRGPSPGVRAGHTAVTIGSKVYVIGGVGDKQYYNDVWVFDINVCLWTQLEVRGQRPQGRFSHTAIVIDTDIALFGGCGEDEHPVNELLVLQLGDEHPNGRYNISLCKLFGKHFNEERKRLSNDLRNYSIARKEEHELELGSKQSLQINSDGLQSKRKRMNNFKTWEIESEPEEHSLSLSQQSSPSQSDQEQTPNKKASFSQMFSFPSSKKQTKVSSNGHPNDDSITPPYLKSFPRKNPHELQCLREHPNNTNPEQNTNLIRTGPFTNMVGAEVRGKIDGSFDSGFLMTAFVNGKIFRGVLFPPGSEVVSGGSTVMARKPSPVIRERASTIAVPGPYANRSAAQPHVTTHLGQAHVKRVSPIIGAPSSNGTERKIKGDLQGVFLTLGGPGSGHG